MRKAHVVLFLFKRKVQGGFVTMMNADFSGILMLYQSHVIHLCNECLISFSKSGIFQFVAAVIVVH